MSIRVLIADGHPLMLEGVRVALARADDLEVVGETSAGRELLSLVHQHRPDVLLLDLRLPEIDGLTCLELLTDQQPDLKVLMMSALVDPACIRAALARGACAYIAKGINPLDLPTAVRQAVEGAVHSFAPMDDGGADMQSVGLTSREGDVLDGVARGLSNRAIARELWVSEDTVKFHLTRVFRKLKVSNRVEAARAAFNLALVESPMLGGPPGGRFLSQVG